MAKWLVLPVVALAYLVGTAAQPTADDGDRDRLPDRWERRHGLSTTQGSAKRDPDRDRLTNRREYCLRTNPRRRDTDGDGYNDRHEIRVGTNPRAPLSHSGVGLTPSQAAASSCAPPPDVFPSPSTTGVPAGWTPARTRSSELRVTQPGAVVQDVLFTNGANLFIDAPNVTVRRVKLQGGWINNVSGSTCRNGLRIEDTTIEPPTGQDHTEEFEGVVSYGGYTARRVKIWRRSEGFRVSGKSSGCGPVRIQDSFAKIVITPSFCDASHGDGIQGYDGPPVTVVNTTIDFSEASCGTAPFFVPDGQGNTSATVDRLLVMGGGYPFRLSVPGSVSGLKIVDRSWGYGPIDVRCSLLSGWDASIVKITDDYQVARTVRPQRCG